MRTAGCWCRHSPPLPGALGVAGVSEGGAATVWGCRWLSPTAPLSHLWPQLSLLVVVDGGDEPAALSSVRCSLSGRNLYLRLRIMDFLSWTSFVLLFPFLFVSDVGSKTHSTPEDKPFVNESLCGPHSPPLVLPPHLPTAALPFVLPRRPPVSSTWREGARGPLALPPLPDLLPPSPPASPEPCSAPAAGAQVGRGLGQGK